MWAMSPWCPLCPWARKKRRLLVFFLQVHSCMLSWDHCFQVIRIDTQGVVAAVMDDVAFGYRADK